MVAPQVAPYQPQPGNGLAVAGMVLGILGLALCWLPFVGWPCALVGIILAALGMSRAKKIGGRGKGMAIAGLICGLIGLFLGVVLFVLATMAVNSFDDYMTKSKRSESSLQLRSIEKRVKVYFAERSMLPASAPEMPGKIADVCRGPDLKFAVAPRSAWTAGWQEIDFSIDEPALCSYEFVNNGQGATAIARCDLDCDGNPSETRVTFRVETGNVVATFGDPSPD